MRGSARGRGAGAGRTMRMVAGLAVGAALAGCASAGGGGTGAEEGPLGAATPEDAVQSFLNAANRDDYQGMSRLFGGTRGPAIQRLGRSEVEQRMFVLAALLGHRNYALRRSGLTEGPSEIRFLVDMTGTRSGNVTVPVIAGEHRGRWYVQQVVTGPLTGTGR